MAHYRVTPNTLSDVFIRFAAWALAEPLKQQKLLCNDLNALLDDLLTEDAFGTEGQLDPRGDQRD